MVVSALIPDMLQKIQKRLIAVRQLLSTEMVFSAVALLVIVEFCELLIAVSSPELPASQSRALWLTLAASTFFLAILLCIMRIRMMGETTRAEAIAEYINDGLLFIDNGVVAYANPLACRLVGGDKTPLVLGLELKQALDQARTSYTPILYEATLEGRIHHFLVSKVASPLKHASSTDRQMFVFQDVTFLRENEEAKVNFIGALSHEIKTPITSLAMALAMLDRTGFDAELVRIANADVGRLRVLLEDLLNVSKLKIVRGPNAMQKRDTNITMLTHHTVKALAPLAEQKGVRIVTRFSQRGQVLASIDPTKFSWVLSTLLTDAIRQTPNSRNVTVTLGIEGGQAVFEVHYMRRLDSLGPTSHAIVRDIIEGHAGRFISLHQADHESIFRFFIHAYVNGDRTSKGIGKSNEANLTG